MTMTKTSRFLHHDVVLWATGLTLLLICVTSVDGRRRAGVTSATSNDRSESSAGQRHSSVRRWIERMMPHLVHGSIQFGPGYGAHLETDFGLNMDGTAKWWLGDNVCVTTQETEETSQPTARPRDIDYSIHDVSSEEENDDEDNSRQRGHRSDIRQHSTHRVRWRWSTRHRGNAETQTGRHRVAYSRNCVEVTTPTEQYRCTTENRLGRTATITTTVYECCPGYKRAPASSDGCNIEIRPDIITSLEESGAAEMSRALNATGLADVLREGEQGSKFQYTVFAPSNSALDGYTPSVDVNLNVVHISRDSYGDLIDRLNGVMADHVIEGRVLSSDFKDNLMLHSALLLDDRKVRINRFQPTSRFQPLLTANCVPLTSVDIPASNGVIHVVGKVLPSAVNSIERLVSMHPNLTVFNSLFRLTMLDAENGNYTIFAPSDAAFARLNPSLLQRLQNGDDQCAARLLKQHVLLHVVCASALKSTVNSILNNHHVNLVNIDMRHINIAAMSSDNAKSGLVKLFANGVQVVEEDLMATNGVVHIIDGILFNESAVGVLELAKSPSMNTNLFAELIESSGLRRRVESTNTSFTVFLPTNDAMKEMFNETGDMVESELQELLSNHLVPHVALTGSDLHNDRTLTTIDNSSKLLIKEYHSFPFSHQSRKTVQCAAIVRTDINANSICSSGIGHVINTVLRRPATSILDILLHDSQFSRLVELFQFARLTYLLTHHGSPVTLIAPTNAAFDILPAVTLRRLTTDVNAAHGVLRSHIISDVMCCTGVFPRQFLQLPINEVNLDGWLMQVERDRQTVTVEQVPIRKCDLMTLNGVVHVVDRFAPSVIDRHVRTGGRSRAGNTGTNMLRTIQDFLGLS